MSVSSEKLMSSVLLWNLFTSGQLPINWPQSLQKGNLDKLDFSFSHVSCRSEIVESDKTIFLLLVNMDGLVPDKGSN